MKVKNPSVAGEFLPGAAFKSHGRWYCRDPYTNRVWSVHRLSQVEIALAAVGFFILTKIFFINLLETP